MFVFRHFTICLLFISCFIYIFWMYRGPYGRLAIELNMSPFLKYCINRINTWAICFHLFFTRKQQKCRIGKKRTGHWNNYTSASHIICIEDLYQGAFVTIQQLILTYSNKFEIAVTYIFLFRILLYLDYICYISDDPQEYETTKNNGAVPWKLFRNSIWWFETVSENKYKRFTKISPRHEISNNVVWVTSTAWDQPAHTRSLIRACASRLTILWMLSYWPNIICSFQT